MAKLCLQSSPRGETAMIKIYGVPISVHTRKALLAARFKGVEYQLEHVFPFDPPPGWTRLSPTGLIPAMVDGDFTLAESSAICRYVDLVGRGPSIYPDDHREHALALSIEAYVGATFFRNVLHSLFHQKVLRPRLEQQPTDETEVARLLTEEQPPIFGHLEGLCGGRFLVGDRLSIADITLVTNLITYCYLGLRGELDAYPKLSAWYDRVLALPEVRDVLSGETSTVAEMGLQADWLEAA
jgi:glutathione S-transferase